VDRAELARRIRTLARLTGRFTLRSGLVTDLYWDKYRFEADPTLLRAIADAMLPLLPAAQYDRLAGLELGGVPLATAISLASGRPCLFVRKAAKPYGTANLVEGGFTAGERAVVVEDVVTSGGQVVESVGAMRALGLIVDHVVCVVDRRQGGTEAIHAAGCDLKALFTIDELEQTTP
jgi:orotate phosphoribosyltransferase